MQNFKTEVMAMNTGSKADKGCLIHCCVDCGQVNMARNATSTDPIRMKVTK